jgi:hypothetical protein
MKNALIILVCVLLVMGINVVAYWSIVQPPVNISGAIPNGSTLMSWDDIMQVTAGTDRRWQIPPALQKWEGKLVTFDGVLFTLPQFRRGDTFEAAVLTPPSRYGCCGLQCSAKPQLMMLCLFSSPMPAWPEKTRIARVTGTVHFNPQADAWTMSELRDAQVIFP